MSILFNFVLNIIAVSFLVSQTDAFGVICTHSDDGLTLVDKVPDNCEYILYSHQYIGDLDRSDRNLVLDNIQTLGKIKPVFVEFSIEIDKINISKFINDENYVPRKDFFDYLDALKISGILLNMVDIQAISNSIKVEDVQNFLILLNNKKPELKIGLMINGYECAIWAKETKEYKFDLLNEHLNFYFIDSSSTEDACNENSSTFGRYRTSDNETTQIKNLATAVKESKMENSKTVIALSISVTNKKGLLIDTKTYEEYCKTKDREDKSNIWCADSMQQLYDLAKYLNSYFGGFALMNFNYDDFKNTCECGIFPVSKAYTQGWNSGERPTCSAISGPAV